MITHNEIVTALWGGGMLAGFIGGWWARGPRRIECDEDHFEIWRNGYEQGCDDELASCAVGAHEEVMPSETNSLPTGEIVPRPGDSGGRTATASGLATMPEATIRPGRFDATPWIDEWGNWVEGQFIEDVPRPVDDGDLDPREPSPSGTGRVTAVGPGHAAAGGSEPSGATGRQPCPECGVEPAPDMDERFSHERYCLLGPRAQGRYPAPDGSQIDSAALNPSPYPNTPLTPAQRRRDRHKRPGEYAEEKAFDPSATYDDLSPLALAEGELPPPPLDLAKWAAAEIDFITRNGQSAWFTEMSIP